MTQALVFKNGKFDQRIHGKSLISWWIDTCISSKQALECYNRMNWSDQLKCDTPELYTIEIL